MLQPVFLSPSEKPRNKSPAMAEGSSSHFGTSLFATGDASSRSPSSGSGSVSIAINAWHCQVEQSLIDSPDSSPSRYSADVRAPDRSSALTPSPGQTLTSRSTNPKSHKGRTCDPCLFFFSRRGCYKGPGCQYCHLHTSSEIRHTPQRPRKQTRDLLKENAKRILTLHEGNPEPSPALATFFRSFSNAVRGRCSDPLGWDLASLFPKLASHPES